MPDLPFPLPAAEAPLPLPLAHAQRVIALTRQAWQVAPESPRAIARHAPRGYVPQRVRRRARAALAAPLLRLAW